MKLDKTLFEHIAAKAAESPRLRMHFDLRDSKEENGQRMLNVFYPVPSQSFIVILTLRKLWSVFTAQQLSAFTMRKAMKRKW